MDISVTSFKHRCLELVRRVEKTGTRVTILRRGRVVARLEGVGRSDTPQDAPPWEQLRALGGTLRATPDESVVRDEEFEALR